MIFEYFTISYCFIKVIYLDYILKFLLTSIFFFYISLVFWDGEGNGTPLQYSCLENPMDGGAW